jgi:hypothetical protein
MNVRIVRSRSLGQCCSPQNLSVPGVANAWHVGDATMLKTRPSFTLRVAEHASSGDVTSERWPRDAVPALLKYWTQASPSNGLLQAGSSQSCSCQRRMCEYCCKGMFDAAANGSAVATRKSA